MAALDHPWNDIVALVTDGDLEHVEDLCRCEHRRPLPADQVDNPRPQPPSDAVQQRILKGVPSAGISTVEHARRHGCVRRSWHGVGLKRSRWTVGIRYQDLDQQRARPM
jgi:hypothetical protein